MRTSCVTVTRMAVPLRKLWETWSVAPRVPCECMRMASVERAVYCRTHESPHVRRRLITSGRGTLPDASSGAAGPEARTTDQGNPLRRILAGSRTVFGCGDVREGRRRDLRGARDRRVLHSHNVRADSDWRKRHLVARAHWCRAARSRFPGS